MPHIPTLLLLLLLLLTLPTAAFPPAPHHTLYGLIRNQWGDPLNTLPAQVFLETSDGHTLSTGVLNFLDVAVNYELQVPMDAGTTADLYKPSALRPFLDYRLRVQIGQDTYLPIEMSGSFAQIGLPGKRTRADLTLGIDSDLDGLPDAWEQAIIAMFGGTLADIDPNGDADGDGISNRDEYLSGTYAFDPTDGFRLGVVSTSPTEVTLDFLAIRGRTYSVQSTADFVTWTDASFRVLGSSASPALVPNYTAPDVRVLQVQVPVTSGDTTNRFYRAIVR